MRCAVVYLYVIPRSGPARQTASPCYSVLHLESSVHYVHPLLMFSSHDNEKRLYFCVLAAHLSLTTPYYAVYQGKNTTIPRTVWLHTLEFAVSQCDVHCAGLQRVVTLATGLLKQGDRLSSTIRNLETVRVPSALRREEKWNIWLWFRPCVFSWCIGYAIKCNFIARSSYLTFSWFIYTNIFCMMLWKYIFTARKVA